MATGLAGCHLALRRITMGQGIARTCWITAGAMLAAVGGTVVAGDQATLVGQPQAIAIEPSAVSLAGPRAQQQIIVTAQYAGGELRDLTPASQFASENPAVVAVDKSGLLAPKGNGSTNIVARVGSREAKIAVTVKDFEKPARVEFLNHVVASLAKGSCSMGACHGSPSGKNGFRLSLRGYDPVLDFESLTRDILNRRTNRMAADESLLLRKPVGKVPHEGGIRLTATALPYQLIRDWIRDGLQADPPNTPQLARLQVLPERRSLTEPARQQQLVALAHMSDGSVRDVTPLAVYSSSNEDVAKVGNNGLVECSQTGEAAILVRYLDQIVTTHVTHLKVQPDFVWSNPPENNFIDKHVFAKLKLLHILPSGVCSDDEFIRRASLDVCGVLPTAAEVRAFLADNDLNKRARLIDRLLERPEYLDFWTLKWSDVLRSNRKTMQVKGIYTFQEWIRDSLAQNKPFDQFVRELLTADGSAFKNPAANYYRVARDPQNCVETTAQLFMGIRIQCAKCHNHPFERWTQNDYYGLAAFFSRVKHKPGIDATDEVVFVDRAGEVTQPRTGQQMAPKYLGGEVANATGPDRRVALAQWLTSGSNSFFAKATVNRIWYHVMGRGIIDPPDDVRDSNPASNEELLAELTRDFVAHGFDVKYLIRTVMNSRAYQLSAETNQWNKDDVAYFSHAQTRLLTAEQLLDAICTSTALPEKFAGLPAGFRATQLPDPEIKHPFLVTFGQPSRELACECERESDSSLSQALQMINGPLIAGKLRDPNNRIGQLLAAKKSDAEITEELYLTTLSRPPRTTEIEAINKHIAAGPDRRKALEDVHWALLNSKEFLFRH
jgi:hypothetical protein